MIPDFGKWHNLGKIIKRENLLSLGKVQLVKVIRSKANCSLSEAYNIATLLLSVK